MWKKPHNNTIIWSGADLTADLTWGRFDWGRFDLGPIWFGADLTRYPKKRGASGTIAPPFSVRKIILYKQLLSPKSIPNAPLSQGFVYYVNPCLSVRSEKKCQVKLLCVWVFSLPLTYKTGLQSIPKRFVY